MATMLRETLALPTSTQYDDVLLCLGTIIGSNCLEFGIECFIMTPFGCPVTRTSYAVMCISTETRKNVTNQRDQFQNKQSGIKRTCPTCERRFVNVTEKFNSTLINLLSKSVGKLGNNWDNCVLYVMFAYRVVVQDSTKSSPFYLLYGLHPRVPTDLALDHPRTVYQIDFDDYAEELVPNLSDAWQLAH